MKITTFPSVSAMPLGCSSEGLDSDTLSNTNTTSDNSAPTALAHSRGRSGRKSPRGFLPRYLRFPSVAIIAGFFLASLPSCSGEGEGTGSTATNTESGTDSTDSSTDSSTGSSTDSSTAKDQTIPEYLQQTWGIVITDFGEDAFSTEDDGSQISFGEGTITVEGLGAQELSTMTIIDSVANGGGTTFFVSKPDLSEERYFLYNSTENYITFGDLTKGVSVSKNPDGTYDVWAFDADMEDQHLTVENGFEALKLVDNYNDFKLISPHILLMAFAVAHTEGPEARSTGASTNILAATPPVCDIFKEFCDCAACSVLEREGACAPCPNL